MSQQPNADFTKITEKASWKVFVRYIYILARHLTSRLLYLLVIVYGDIKGSKYVLCYIYSASPSVRHGHTAAGSRWPRYCSVLMCEYGWGTLALGQSVRRYYLGR